MSNTKQKEEKYMHYAMLIQGAIATMFDEDSESDYKIDQKELQEGDNLTHFFQALANVVPCNMYAKITGDDVNSLEFNHIANKLCFQFSKKIENEEG